MKPCPNNNKNQKAKNQNITRKSHSVLILPASRDCCLFHTSLCCQLLVALCISRHAQDLPGACVVSTRDQPAETATSVLRSSPCPWYFPLPSLQSLLGLSLGRQPPLLEEFKYIDSGRGREETHAHPRLLGPAVSFSTAWRQRKHREKQEQGS